MIVHTTVVSETLGEEDKTKNVGMGRGGGREGGRRKRRWRR